METYRGQVKTPNDAVILFEACRMGLLPRVQRRLSEKERQTIRSGSVFVWDEREAGMRRWTDGKSWSASRVNGSFLTYREMEGKRGGAGQSFGGANASEHSGEGNENGAESPDGYRYKPDGLTKQSFSITTTQNQRLHLISYYSRTQPDSPKQQPSNDARLRHIRPEKGMYPESTVPESNNVPAMTQSPMMVPPYSSSPQSHSAASTPGYSQPRSMYGNPSAGYPWLPPSPMQTPPAQYSPYQNGYFGGSPASSPYYNYANGSQYANRPPPGPTAFDRAPPPINGVTLPWADSSKPNEKVPSTMAPPSQGDRLPPVSYFSQQQGNRFGQPQHVDSRTANGALHQRSHSYNPPLTTSLPSPSESEPEREKKSAASTMPSLNALMNPTSPKDDYLRHSHSPPRTGPHAEQLKTTMAEDTRAISRLNRAFVV